MIVSKLEKLISNKYFHYLVYVFFVFVFLLSRTFMGVNILGFRVGELAILTSFVFLILFMTILFKSNIVEQINSNQIYLSLILFTLTFLLLVFYSDGSFSNLYIYKSSSYIWSLGFIVLGLVIGNTSNISQKNIYPFFFICIFIYFYSIYGIPDSYQSIFLNFSDKFEYHKGSDILIMTITTIFLNNRLSTNKRFSLELFLVLSVLYLPLLLYKSRGAFISFCLFVLLEAFHMKQSFRSTIRRNAILIFILVAVLLQSLFFVTKSGFFNFSDVDDKVEFVTGYRAVPIEDEDRLIYINNNRIFSSDGNLNWRLQIWQDIVIDLNKTGKIWMGYQFNEKIPAMDDPFRSGDDGTNENVHNFLINIFARGGLIHLGIYIYFIFNLLRERKSFAIINFVAPLFLASLFDASMENSHFPLIFYFVVGFSLCSKKVFKI